MNLNKALAVLLAATALLVVYLVFDVTVLIFALIAVLLTGIPFWMWLGEKRALLRQSREPEKSKKDSGTEDNSAPKSADTKATVTKESVKISREDKIAKYFWFIQTSWFWLILLVVIVTIFLLHAVEIINLRELSWPELSEGLSVAAFLILLGLVMLILWPWFGRLLMVLGFAVALLYLLLPNSISWIGLGVNEDATLSTNVVTVHKRLEVNIPADGKTEVFYNNDPAKCLLPIFERPEEGLPLRVVFHPDYGLATYEQMAELQNHPEPSYQSIVFAGNGKSYRMILEWRGRGQCTSL